MKRAMAVTVLTVCALLASCAGMVDNVADADRVAKMEAAIKLAKGTPLVMMECPDGGCKFKMLQIGNPMFAQVMIEAMREYPSAWAQVVERLGLAGIAGWTITSMYGGAVDIAKAGIAGAGSNRYINSNWGAYDHSSWVHNPTEYAPPVLEGEAAP